MNRTVVIELFYIQKVKYVYRLIHNIQIYIFVYDIFVGRYIQTYIHISNIYTYYIACMLYVYIHLYLYYTYIFLHGCDSIKNVRPLKKRVLQICLQNIHDIHT